MNQLQVKVTSPDNLVGQQRLSHTFPIEYDHISSFCPRRNALLVKQIYKQVIVLQYYGFLFGMWIVDKEE
jgi:hypothetical protein